MKLTNEEIRTKVLEGIKLARKKLVEQAKKNDSYLIILRKGKVERVRARDIKV